MLVNGVTFGKVYIIITPYCIIFIFFGVTCRLFSGCTNHDHAHLLSIFDNELIHQHNHLDWLPYLFSCCDGTPSAGCHSTSLSHDGTPIMGCHDVFYSWWNFLNGMSWLAHYVSWWNSLTYGDVMTTKYLYKGETTSRMQIVIETVPVHCVKNRLFQFIMWNTETVPVHLVKYRNCSSSLCEIQRLFFVQVIQWLNWLSTTIISMRQKFIMDWQ